MSVPVVQPTFLGIGAKKCASTWVYRILQEHPEVGVSEPKELNFFSHHFDHGFCWYERHFSACRDAAAVGEVSPSYFHDPRTPLRVAARYPSCKIIVVLRDPVSRAYSHHVHEVRLGHHVGPDQSFESGLRHNPDIIEQSRYATHLERWLQVFPAAQVLVLFQEEIAADPALVAARVFSFLQVDSDFQPGWLGRVANASYLERVKGLEHALRTLGRVGRRAGLHQVVNTVRGLDPVRGLRAYNRRRPEEVVAPMRPETENELRGLLQGEEQALTQLLDRPLPWQQGAGVD